MRMVALLAVLALSGCSRRAGREPRPPDRPPAGEPAILHFYAYPAAISKGEHARICYGVENASTARIDPQPGGVPAYANRCFEIGPQRTTEYVLSAEDSGGRRVWRSLKVIVTAPEAKPEAKAEAPPRPRITSFTASAQQISREETVTLCYETIDATDVRIEPPVVDFRLPARGCFGHAPERNTTYRLTATGPGGADTREVPITVR
ncbi:MAG: hypothetical protein Q8N47_14980 [Bryobacterales bacterium]|nr:hypothetical protein [Bryobacterales bacterium]